MNHRLDRVNNIWTSAASAVYSSCVVVGWVVAFDLLVVRVLGNDSLQSTVSFVNTHTESTVPQLCMNVCFNVSNYIVFLCATNASIKIAEGL